MTKKKKRTITSEEADTTRIENLAARKRQALEELAEVRSMETDLEGEDGAEVSPPDGQIENPRVTEILSEIENAGTFCVYKLDRGMPSKVGQFPVSDWPDAMDKLAREAGGGTFRIQFRNSDGRQVGQITQTFDPKFYKADVPPTNPADGSLALLVESIRESKRDMLEMMKLFMSRPADNGLIKTANDLAALVPLLKGKENGGVENMIELFTTALELGKKIGTESAGGSDGESITGRIVSTLINAVGKPVADQLARSLVTGQAPRKALPGAVPKSVVTAPVPDAVTPPALNPPQEETTMPPEVTKVRNSFFFKLYAPGIIAAAQMKEPPQEYAAQIIDRVPESWDGILFDIVSRPDVVDYLAYFEPAVKLYPDWFKSLADEIKVAYDVAPETPEVPANGKDAPGVLLEV